MKLKYTLSSKNILTTCSLKKSDLKNAMFYLYKEHDKVGFNVEYMNESLDFSTKIYKEESLKTVFKVFSNTTDILITDIQDGDTPYYFEVVSSDGSYVSVSEITLKTPFISIELNGRVYTNSFFTNYEIFEGVFITSIPTIDTRSFSFKFLKDSIVTTVKKRSDSKHFSKPFSTSIISLKTVNDNMIRLPSFYLNTKKHIDKYVAGDIVNLQKKELVEVGGNYIKLKDCAVATDEGIYEYRSNTIFLSEFYIETSDKLIEYIAERSSHDFEVLDTLYMKLNKGLLEVVEEVDADFSINKVVDNSKFNLLPNKHMNKRAFKIDPIGVGLQFSDDTFLKKMLTNFKKIKIKSPSKVKYININNKTIHQKDSDIFNTKVISMEDLSDHLDVDKVFRHKLDEKSIKRVSIEFTNTDYESYYE